ncbi:hypothetical protein FALCPG4_003003 [Fusarium falciforme]
MRLILGQGLADVEQIFFLPMLLPTSRRAFLMRPRDGQGQDQRGPGLTAQGGKGLSCHEGIPGLWEGFWCNCRPGLEMAMSPVGWVVPRLWAALPFPEQNVGQPQSQGMSTESGEPELYLRSRCFGKTRTIAVATRGTRAQEARYGVVGALGSQCSSVDSLPSVAAGFPNDDGFMFVCLSVRGHRRVTAVRCLRTSLRGGNVAISSQTDSGTRQQFNLFLSFSAGRRSRSPPTQAQWTGMLSIVLEDVSLVSPSLDSSLPPQPAWSQVTPGEMNEYPGSVGLVATDGL